jgi:hypothetical protein
MLEDLKLYHKTYEYIKTIIDYEIQYFNYHNLDDSLQKTTELLEKVIKEYDEINVNISSGTTLLKMAFMLAANYYPIKLFYVIPAEYTHPGEIITTGARGLVDLPSINLSHLSLPKKKQADILKLIDAKPKKFTEIAKDYAKLNGLKLSQTKLKELKAWIFYHIKKLETQSLISTEIEGNNLMIKLTQTGKFIKLIQQHKQTQTETQTKLKIKKKNIIDA